MKTVLVMGILCVIFAIKAISYKCALMAYLAFAAEHPQELWRFENLRDEETQEILKPYFRRAFLELFRVGK